MLQLQIESEIAPLEAVVLHSPGAEIEAMTPSTARELLYNEIVPLAVVQTDHRQFKEAVQLFSTVYELRDLIVQTLNDEALRTRLCRDVAAGDERVLEELLPLQPNQLTSAIIEGVPLRKDSLAAYLSERVYAHHPLPNLYFMRDSAAVVRSGFISGAMAHPVRAPESLLVSTALSSMVSPDAPHLFDGGAQAPTGGLLEGGDLLVLDRNTLIAGLSERTNATALDQLLITLTERFQEPFRVIAVVLPRERYAIHLDMLFTLIDDDCALAYGPSITGETPLPVVSIYREPAGKPAFSRYPSLPACLTALGHDIETVLCGGADPVRQEREQWMSGTNALALAPGVIVVYDCNTATLRELDRAGFRVATSADLCRERAGHGGDLRAGSGRLAITIPGAELARGGGGPRCMSLPLRRRSNFSRGTG